MSAKTYGIEESNNLKSEDKNVKKQKNIDKDIRFK